ncbi:MAG: putative glycolipid-binding domain-containing protein [Chloroflexi bacterium]|nr:putative glycolipid-binding domain-containing protein [Chloroflexota bacterium]OJW04371.1 MAG: hypothetical protein BGO39_11475 [Chloroflexi bacterium 54-19]
MQKIIRWASSEGEGLEQLHLTVDDRGVRARSVVVGGDAEEATTWAIGYEVECDPLWRVRRVKIWDTTTGNDFELLADGSGNWTGPDGQPRPEFAGCLDVDIRATPFTNTLPVRRLSLKPGETASIRVLYIPLPELDPFPVVQHYTKLGPQVYRYESESRDFVRDLTLDGEGLVIDYPGLFHRTL